MQLSANCDHLSLATALQRIPRELLLVSTLVSPTGHPLVHPTMNSCITVIMTVDRASVSNLSGVLVFHHDVFRGGLRSFYTCEVLCIT